MDGADDLHVRLAAFAWLREQNGLHDGVLPRAILAQGLVVDGERVPLLGPQGIFKPRVCELPLSITTIPTGRYPDAIEEGVLRYSYRGTDPRHPDNVGLREAWRRRTPLALFCRIGPGAYVSAVPVFVVGDEPARLRFDVQVDDMSQLTAAGVGEGPGAGTAAGEDRREIRRAYVTASFRRRLHQQAFRERVLAAYRSQCSICRLRHRELLDAAHIVGDAEAEGDPLVTNGVALCKLHHAAFDSFFLTITPDYVVEVRRAILEESDGPMLLVGLKETHGRRIELPRATRDRPDRDRLERRYERFRIAS